MSNHNQKEINTHCGNCNYPINNAKYCSECGQKNTDGRISVKEFFSVTILTVFNLESKFFQTIRDIFIPGKLTTEWFKGKHKPYFHPVRLFIVTALLLIAVLSLFITKGSINMTDNYERVKQESYRKGFIKEINNYSALYARDEIAKTTLDSLAKTMKEGHIDSGIRIFANYGKKHDLPSFKDKSLEEVISFSAKEFGNEITDSIINVIKSKKRLSRDSIQLMNLVGDGLKKNISNEDFLNLSPQELLDKYQIKGFFRQLHFKQRIKLQKGSENVIPFMLANSLWIALILMPFLAIILKLFYIKLDYYYLEHLIFSFHVHSFAFIVFAIICVFMKLVYVHPLIVLIGFLVLFIYLYKSLRKVYKQSRLKTITKLLFINIIYLVLFFSFAILGIIISLFLF